MAGNGKRVAIYGVAGVVLAGLVYVGFFHEADADPMTLLGSANAQISLARSFPEKDREGNPNQARVKILSDAKGFIDRARKQEPDLHAGIELDAHISWMNGDFERAATLFREAQASRESTPETSVIDRLNEARMWRAADDPEQALEILEKLSTFLASYSSKARLEQAYVLIRLEREDEALEIASRLACSAKDTNVLLGAAGILESRNEIAKAEVALRAAAESEPLVNYWLAKLKIHQEDFDTGLDLLKRAAAADGRRIRTMLTRDAKLWKPVEEDQRFKDLLSSPDKPASPGR